MIGILLRAMLAFSVAFYCLYPRESGQWLRDHVPPNLAEINCPGNDRAGETKETSDGVGYRRQYAGRCPPLSSGATGSIPLHLLLTQFFGKITGKPDKGTDDIDLFARKHTASHSSPATR